MPPQPLGGAENAVTAVGRGVGARFVVTVGLRLIKSSGWGCATGEKCEVCEKCDD